MDRVFAGIDIGGTRIKVGLAATSGELLSCQVLDTSRYHDAVGLLEAVQTEIIRLASDASVVVMGAGVGCPGRIDFTGGTPVWLKTKLEYLEGFPLAEHLAKALRCPVVCDNDVNTILAGEMRFGAGRGYQNAIAITVGTGIGGAVVMDGRMIRGTNWATGHFGYMSFDLLGARHVCGNTGVVEAEASQSGLLFQLHEARIRGEISPLTAAIGHGEEVGLREVFECADAGDPVGKRLADRLICGVGALIANLVYALDPEIVLVGGGIVTHRPSMVESLRREVVDRVRFLSSGATKISPMALGDASGVLGGVALAIDEIGGTEH
jgi:glucokinase